MEIKEIPIVIVFAINLLLAAAGLSDREKSTSRPMGMLALSVACWAGAVLWEHWTRSGTSRLFLSTSLVSGPLWISWALSRKSGIRSLPMLPAALLFLYIPIWIALPDFSHLARTIALVVGYLNVFFGLWLITADHEDLVEDAKTMLYALVLSFGAAGLLAVASIFIPALLRPYDQAGAVVACEAILFAGLRRRWIPAEKLVGRGIVWVVYAVIAGGVLFIPLALISWLLGSPMPFWALMGLVAVALASAAIFPWMGPKLTELLESALFPEASKMEQEIARLRGDLDDVRQKLRFAERMRLVGEIAAQVAHEIKNPLGPIKGYAKLLLEDARAGRTDAAATEKGLRIIAEEAERIDERISRLLGMARETTRERQATDINLCCRRAAMLLEAGGDLKPEGRVELNLSGDVSVLADGPAIEEAIYNLLLNASQATEGRGKIKLTTLADVGDSGKQVVIEVSDDGPGFSCDDPETLFNPFYTTRPDGAGLGLGIVRNIIKRHGGTIEASKNQGGGAVFTIRLPT